MRSRLCVRQFREERLRDDLFAGTPDTFLIKYLLAKAASWKDFGILVIEISVAFMHARPDEEIYVKVPSGIKSSKFWRVRAAVNGTRKASKQWQEYSSDKLVKSMLFQQNDINPCIHKNGFLRISTWNSTVAIFLYADYHQIWNVWQKNSRHFFS